MRRAIVTPADFPLPHSAIAFANNSAQVNPNTTAQLCAIFAKSSANWRTAVHKAFIPEDLVGDSADATQKAELEQARLDHVAQAVPGVNATEVVKFSLLDRQSAWRVFSLFPRSTNIRCT